MIERLEFEELSAPLQEALRPRVERLGYLGEYLRVAGHQPAALQTSLALMEELKRDLDPRIVEVVALTQSAWFENAYERIQHERLADKLGFGRGWIAAVLRLDPDGAPDLTVLERAVQRFVLAMLASKGRDVAPLLEPVVEALGSRPAVALLLLIGKYAGDSLVMNAAGLTPPAPSIFSEARA